MAADTLRLIFNRLFGRRTIVNADLLGQPVKLDITARRELRRANLVCAFST